MTPTTPAELDRHVESLTQGAAKWLTVSLDKRIEIVDQCIDRVLQVANEWVNAGCEAKGISRESTLRSEELTTGPVSTLRFLQLIRQTFCDVRDHGQPKIPDVRKVDGQCRVSVMPTPLLFDSILFRPLKAETWLSADVSIDSLHEESLARLRGHDGTPKVEVVLGAGNVSSIPATDALTKILIENCAVVLKMNPVNEYLGKFFADAFKPLIDADVLRIVYGGIDPGKYLIEHHATTGVHITGSIHSHDAIVWGTDDQRESRRERNETVITKSITSELGNVSPWAIVPGKYTTRELRFQAEMIATSITNNVSFNCIATKLILMCRDWPQREEFSALLNGILDKTPTRDAYYPGATQRFTKFSGIDAPSDEQLPWTILPDVDPLASPHLLCEESFAPVCGELLLDAVTPLDFLAKATDMMNDQIWGTLAASFTLPSDFRKKHATELDASLHRLRFGTIGLNIWPALSFALMSPPWGGHPCGTLRDAQSGIGFVHNTYLLDRPEKTVLQAPLTMSPKPIWHSNHRHPQRVTADLLRLYHRPNWLRMLPLSISSFTG